MLVWKYAIGATRVLLLSLGAWSSGLCAPPSANQLAQIDLTEAFHTKSPWRLTVWQAPPSADPFTKDSIPGEVTVCLAKANIDACDDSVAHVLTPNPQNTDFATAHFLNDARIVFSSDASGHRPILLIKTASRYSDDGDAFILTQLLAYDKPQDEFQRIHSHVTGHNNNQEERFVTTGLLKGRVIVAEPTYDAPFGYWMTVFAPGPAFQYRAILHYRSATHYADGNTLPVIDSEMPNIEKRLEIRHRQNLAYHSSQDCPMPHLKRSELWCH